MHATIYDFIMLLVLGVITPLSNRHIIVVVVVVILVIVVVAVAVVLLVLASSYHLYPILYRCP